MKSLLRERLKRELIDHVWGFVKRHHLQGPQGKVVIGLSGGADSMLLAHLCVEFYNLALLKSVRFVHVDHGLREESRAQAQTLETYADSWGWDLTVTTIDQSPPTGDIENWARKKRHHLLKSALKEGEVLFLAHNIDDSFEWYMKSLLGSSQGNLVMGIPLINNHIRRPLHCLTRKQIESLVRGIPLIQDPSNSDQRFERNKVRATLKGPLLDIFPKGLAHYVERANQWAHSLEAPQKSFHHIIYRDGEGNPLMSVLFPVELGPKREERSQLREAFKREATKAIKLLSQKERGELRENINKLATLFESGQNSSAMNFSGGVCAKSYPDLMIFYPAPFKALLDQLFEQLKETLATQIPRQRIQLKEMTKAVLQGEALPVVLYRQKTFGLNGLKEDSLLGELINVEGPDQWHIRPLTQLISQAKKQGRYTQALDGFCIAF